ncbi:ABC transporter [Halobacteriales archaeon QS_1_68_17]|nr:MAG: ABC transporter [Halobacteriales archaeon QS_1_68_17]
MLRAVLAVVLAGALLAVSLPAIDDARADRTAAHLRSEAGEFERELGTLVAGDDAVRPGKPGARRVISLRLPRRSFAAAGVEVLRINSSGAAGRPGSTRIVWHLAGGRNGSLTIDVARVQRADGDGPLVLREPGTHRLAASLRRTSGGRVVVLRRLNFKPDREDSRSHAPDA